MTTPTIPTTPTRTHSSARLARSVLIAFATMALGFAALVAAPVGIASARPAYPAHAKYVSSVPAANAILKIAPTVVTVHFAENVNPTGSSLTVYDSNGKQVSVGTGQVDRSDLMTMTVNMQGDTSEIYLVLWNTISADDGASDIGAFTFLVNPSSATITSVNGSSSSPSTNATSSGSSGTPVWLTVLVGILGLLIGAGVAYYFARMRGVAGPTNRAAGSGAPGA